MLGIEAAMGKFGLAKASQYGIRRTRAAAV
jgi:hypothetical protein